jgi:hypothetical protein
VKSCYHSVVSRYGRATLSKTEADLSARSSVTRDPGELIRTINGDAEWGGSSCGKYSEWCWPERVVQ